jgi:hypothetical protein
MILTAINSLADVRPGDFCFTKISRPRAAAALVRGGQLLLGERVRIGALSVDHVIVVTEAEGANVTTTASGITYSAPVGAQAMPRGAERVTLTPERHWGPGVAYCRLPEDYPGQALDAAAVAEAMVRAGVAYSFGSYGMLAAWRYGVKADWLEKRIDRRRPPGLTIKRQGPWPGQLYTPRLPVEAICSVFADECWTAIGKQVMDGVPRQVVTPGALAMKLWWRTPGVVWGGAGMLG